MKHLKSIIRSAVFLSILVSSLLAINQVLVPKYFLRNNSWPTTATYKTFYDMEKDSIDVLFLGSSVVVNAFIPQEIYNEYGIRSYNLGSEQQSIYLSYYWLKEALRFQKPKAVVLDLKYIRDIHPNNVINTVEPLARKCLDPMKWSSVKFEAVHNLCQLNESLSELSFYLTNIRFHSRWSEIQEFDINDEMVKSYYLKGFGPMTSNGPASYTTYEQKDKSVKTEFVPLMQNYLDRITELCKENDIRLILIDLPGNYMNDAVNNTHTDYAEKNGIEYYNLCSTLYYNRIGAKLPEESAVDHNNIWGAIKTSRFIGKILRDEYGIGSVYDEQYEASREYYEQILSNSNLVRITGQEEYLNALKNPNYAVFITAQGNTAAVFNREEVKNGLSDLGFECKFTDAPADAYVAVVIGGEVAVEETAAEKLTYAGAFRNRHSVYSIVSCGKLSSSTASIIIEGGQYCRKENGLNIAVYDLNTFKVIDKVTFRGDKLVR